MARLIVTELLSLDGCMEDPGGGEKSPFGGWAPEYESEDYHRLRLAELLASEVLLLGRRTYEGFASAWPGMSDPEGRADKLNGMEKQVVTATLPSLDWSNARILTGDIAAEVARLKARVAGDILILGSQNLASFLVEEGLVDEIRLLIHPVMVGGGLRFFEGLPRRMAFSLQESRQLDKGVILAVYHPVRP